MSHKHLIKKYPNRRLYDTAISGYITLADVKQMILEGENIEVRDAKSDEDLTRQVLLQILLEEEAGGRPILSNDMLRQFIRIYGHSTQSLLTPFLEQNMRIFADWQHNVQQQMKGGAQNWLTPFTFGSGTPSLAEWQKQLQKQSLQFWQTMGWLPKE